MDNSVINFAYVVSILLKLKKLKRMVCKAFSLLNVVVLWYGRPISISPYLVLCISFILFLSVNT